MLSHCNLSLVLPLTNTDCITKLFASFSPAVFEDTSKVYKHFTAMPVIFTCSCLGGFVWVFFCKMLLIKTPVVISGQFSELPRHIRNPRSLAVPAQSSLVLPKPTHSPGPPVGPPRLSASTPVMLQQGQSPASHSPAQPSDGPKSQPHLIPSPGRCPKSELELPLCLPQLPCLIWQLLSSTPVPNHCPFRCHQHKAKPATSGSRALGPSLQAVSMEVSVMLQGTDTSNQLLKKQPKTY